MFSFYHQPIRKIVKKMKKMMSLRTKPVFRNATKALTPRLIALMILGFSCLSFIQPQTPPDFVTLNANTTVRIKLAQNYAQKDLIEGTDVEFRVERDVAVDDYITVISTNAVAYGTVMENTARKVVIEFRDVIAVDTKPILLDGKFTVERSAREGSILLKQGMTVSPKVKNHTRIRLTAR
jgi:hypothetical protein